MSVGKVVSVVIGTSITQVCEVTYNKKHTTVFNSLIFETPENTIEDGYIRDKETFAGILKDEMKNAGIKGSNFVFSIASNRILSREVTIPLVKDHLIKGIVEAEKNEYFPMDISQHIVTYSILEQHKEEKQMRLMLFAIPTNLIKNYLNLAETIGCHIVALNYAGNSIYQWMKKPEHEQVDVLLLISEDHAIFTILDNGILALQRNINFSTKALIDILTEDKESGGMKRQEAIEAISSGKISVEMKERLQEVLRPLYWNLARILEFYTSKSRQGRIASITLAGAGTRIAGLEKEMSAELGIPVLHMEKLTDVSFKKASKYAEQSSDFLECVGATIPSINFITPLTEIKEEKGMSMLFCLIVMGIAVIGSGALFLTSKINYDRADEKNKNMVQQIAELSVIEDVYSEFLRVTAGYQDLKEFDFSINSPHENFNLLLEELENKLPSSTMVHSFGSTADGVNINVTVATKDEAAKLLLQMQLIPYFESVQISGLTEVIDEFSGNSEVSFSLQCKYKPVNLTEEETTIPGEALEEAATQGGAD